MIDQIVNLTIGIFLIVFPTIKLFLHLIILQIILAIRKMLS